MIFHKEGAEGVHLTLDDNAPVGLDTDQEIFTCRLSGAKLPQVCRITSIFPNIYGFLHFFFFVNWYTDSVKGIRDRFFL